MSPYAFESSNAYVFNVSSVGYLYSGFAGNSRAAVPVVSLKPEATVKRGTGAYNDPYVILVD